MCLQAERLQRSGRVGNGWRRKKELWSCAVQSLPHRAGLHQRHLSLLSLFAQLGLKHALAAHTYSEQILSLSILPWYSLCAGPAALEPVPGILQDAAATPRSMALKHSLVPGQAPGHWEWGLEGAFRQAEDAQRGFSLQGGAARCDRAAFVQLITLPSPISERSPGAETDQVCFY